mmetsp:Transcript_11621/g.21301  ORF Transcript_11621/g.21301 Transcript_11621/m.21301 type:complete len:192 (+) Transcript_11621:335-910(+)
MKLEDLKRSSPVELLLRWVNMNLYTAVHHFEEKGQNLEAVLNATGKKLPLTDFSDDWGVMIPVLVLAGLMGRMNGSEEAVSFAAQVMVEDDFQTQVEMIEEQIRGRGGNKALAFFLGDVDAMDNLSTKDRGFVSDKMNTLFSMVVLNECSGYDEPPEAYDSEDEFDLQTYKRNALSLKSTIGSNSTLSLYH